MKYSKALIDICESPFPRANMYTVVLLCANALVMELNGVRCFIDGKYMLCLNPSDTLTVPSGSLCATGVHFAPCFIDRDLTFSMIKAEQYDSLRSQYSYTDFSLFENRSVDYFGIIKLSDSEYSAGETLIGRITDFIEGNENDGLWSCRSRGDLFSLLRIAENAYNGTGQSEGQEILRYINDNLGEPLTLSSLCTRFSTNRTTLSRIIKSLTGKSPCNYILEMRLDKSRSELLFTDIPIFDIAFKFGFENVNYYIRAFKKRYFVPPQRYRSEGLAERISAQGKWL